MLKTQPATQLLRALCLALLLLAVPAALYAASGQTRMSVMPVGGTPVADEEILAQLEEPFTLQLGDWALISDATDKVEVQLVDLISDSRCPAGVNCVVAGEARFTLNLRVDDGAVIEEGEIGQMPIQDQNKIRYEPYTIEMVTVEPPAPAPNKRLRPNQYRVTLVVHEDGSDQPHATPTEALLPTPTATAIMPGDDPVKMNQPFLLRVGESVTLADSELSVTLRSLSDDSGCFTKDDCSTMTADGSLALRNGDDRELASFMTSFDPDTPFVYEFSGYEIVLTHVEQDETGEPVATFLMRKPGIKLPFPIPDPQTVERCPTFSRFDAAAILQEDIAPEAVSNLIYGPLSENTPTLSGLCGYLSVAPKADVQVDPNLPQLLTTVDAAHWVVAGSLQGIDAYELLPLVEASRLANPQGDDMDVLRIQTQLTAGQLEEVIRTILNNAQASETMQVTPLSGPGDEAIWIWQPVGEGYFASILARKDSQFALVSALVDGNVQEMTSLDYMLSIANRILMPERTLAPVETPEQPDVTPEPEQPSGQGCDLLSVKDAAAILGEEVYDQTVTQDEGCGYVPRTELAPDDPDFDMASTDYGILIAQLNRADTHSHLESLVEELGTMNPTADADTLEEIKAMLATGDLQGILPMLSELTAGVEDLHVEILSDVSENTLLFWGKDNDHALLSVTMLNDKDEAVVLYASLHSVKVSAKSKKALIELFQQIAQQQ
ncbi:MAG: hypothetical protein U0175_32595 [Caldilineaceae bacterium]